MSELLLLLQRTYFRHVHKPLEGDIVDERIVGMTDTHRHLVAHLGLVTHAARQVKRKGSADFHDLVQEGNMLLITASVSHNPDVAALSTYTVPYLKPTMKTYLKQQSFIGVPVAMQDTIGKIRDAEFEYRGVSGSTTMDKTGWIANKLKMTRFEVEEALSLRMKNWRKPVSLEKYVRDAHVAVDPYKEEDPNEMMEETGHEWVQLKDVLPDEKSPQAHIGGNLERCREKIAKVMRTLSYREREIVKLRYGLGEGYAYTLEEVAEIFRVTRERIRQIEAKAVRKLQQPSRSGELSEFADETFVCYEDTPNMIFPAPPVEDAESNEAPVPEEAVAS